MKSSSKVLMGLLLILSVTVVMAGPRRRSFKKPNKPPIVVPAISVADASCSEGHEGVRLMNFPVTLSLPTNFNVQVSFSVGGLTATSGSDYTTTTGTVLIPSGQTSSVISVSIIGDTAIEADETLSVTLMNPVHAVIGNSTAVGTITNDDVPVVTGIAHGTDVCTANIALAGKSVSSVDLTVSPGGNASVLANGTDSETGLPRLFRLDITGTVYINVPCVIEQCRITKAGDGVSGWYTVANSNNLNWIMRDSELYGPLAEDGHAVSAVVLYPRTMQRCVVAGGIDGVKVFASGGCLVEDCFIYGQYIVGTSHSDGVQLEGGDGTGDWDQWIFRRCRIEGSYKGEICAMILQTRKDTTVNSSVVGVTIQDCFLAGGPFTVQTRQFSGWSFTKSKINGCIWERDSWLYGPYSSDASEVLWSNNYTALATGHTLGSPVVVSDKVVLP